MDATTLICPNVATMAPYTPIFPFEVLANRLGRDPGDIVKLDANENPYDPAPGVRAALANLRYAHIYPDPQSHALRAALAEFSQTFFPESEQIPPLPGISPEKIQLEIFF